MREHGDVEAVSRWRLALSGAVAGLAGVVVSHVLTSLLNGRATPVQLVSEVVIVTTPGAVAESLIGLVGRYDKPILVSGVTLAVIAFGALAGLLTARRRLWGHLVFWAMAAVALVAAVTRPDFTPYTLLPLGAGVIAWTVLLDHLTRVAQPRPTLEASRRRFLLNVGGVTLLAGAVAASGRLVGRSRRAVETARRLLRLPVTRGVVPAGAQSGAAATPWRVPNGEFYRIDTALVIPAVDPNDWKIRIHGLVDRELTLTYRELVAREITEAWVTICCRRGAAAPPQ